MKYIKKFESQKYEKDDIVVSIVTDIPFLIKGHYYVVIEDDNKNQIYVKDIVNNEPKWIFKDCVVSEYEYLYGEDTRKYNL